jgi:hypothetical protein
MISKPGAARSGNPSAKWFWGLRHAEPSRNGLWHCASERANRSPAHGQQAVKILNAPATTARAGHRLHEVGLVKEIKPEHIDPHAFFTEGE